MVIEHTPLEDELGDILDKAMRHAALTEQELGLRADVSAEKIRDAIDYRYDLSPDELRRLAAALKLNEVGLLALAQGKYPLPSVSGLPFCLYPLRTPYGIGVANAYIVSDCASGKGILFDTGGDLSRLRRVWPKAIQTIEAIFVTHSETEHAGGVEGLVKQFGRVPVYAPEGASVPFAAGLDEGARVSFGMIEVKTLRTPGHVEAHNCYLVSVPRVVNAPTLLISGDLLFAGSAGAPYFCRNRLVENVRRVLNQLPENTVVAPGHGPLTTVKNERRFNPFAV